MNVLSTKEILYNFQISRETLRRWTERGCPKLDRGQFDLQAVIQWRDQHILQFGQDELAKARLRREMARAKREELETAEKEGSLVTRDAAVSWLINLGMAVRISFLQMSRRLFPDDKQREELVRTEVHRIFRILYEGRKDAEKMIRQGTFLTNHPRNHRS